MLFLDDADLTYISKDKEKLNMIIKNHSIEQVTFFFFWNPAPSCKFYLWGKDVFIFDPGSQ